MSGNELKRPFLLEPSSVSFGQAVLFCLWLAVALVFSLFLPGRLIAGVCFGILSAYAFAPSIRKRSWRQRAWFEWQYRHTLKHPDYQKTYDASDKQDDPEPRTYDGRIILASIALLGADVALLAWQLRQGALVHGNYEHTMMAIAAGFLATVAMFLWRKLGKVLRKLDDRKLLGPTPDRVNRAL